MKTKQNNSTEQNLVRAKTNQKLNDLFMKPEILHDDLKGLTDDETKKFNEMLTTKLEQSIGLEKDIFLNQIKDILSPQTKEDIWEHNHAIILNFIHRHLQEYGTFPSKSTIVTETRLSRTSVNKHLKEYQNHPAIAEQEENFKLMKGNILGMIYKSAANGNPGAAKLLLEQTGLAKDVPAKNQHVIQNQHNYIQINGVKLSQEQIQKLEPEKLIQLEEILKKSLLALTSPEPEKAA